MSSFADQLAPEPAWMQESRLLLDRYVDHVFMEPTLEEMAVGMSASIQAPFQREVCYELQKWKSYPMGDVRRKEHTTLILEARGWGKSTWICIYYPTWRIGNNRNPMIKDASFYAFGVGGATINRRADIILADYIVDKENASTLLQREKLKIWFWESVVPILEPGGQLVVSGTRYHSKELYEDLIKLWQDVYSPADDAIVDTSRFERRPCQNPSIHGV